MSSEIIKSISEADLKAHVVDVSTEYPALKKSSNKIALLCMLRMAKRFGWTDDAQRKAFFQAFACKAGHGLGCNASQLAGFAHGKAVASETITDDFEA